MIKKIVYLTGTRADFGKLKSLIQITQTDKNYEVHIFATGMHLNSKYGKTVDEIEKSGFNNIFQFINHDSIENMDRTLAKTIDGFSHYVKEIKPDLVIVHGDRVEALAGAIVGSLNNILVAHIEGGEVSGTIDELIRHAVSKMSHIHFVSNDEAKSRLIQLGEITRSIFTIGSPDLDLMQPKSLPDINLVKNYYDINFETYSIAMFHPVTTEHKLTLENAKSFVDALIESNKKYIVIYPNNDLGSDEILKQYERLNGLTNFKIFPSLRFEYFLTLLKHSKFIIGNSSAGIREAPYYNIPTVNVGTRQNNRAILPSIINANSDKISILNSIKLCKKIELNHIEKSFGDGNSCVLFKEILDGNEIWKISHQKQFQEIK